MALPCLKLIEAHVDDDVVCREILVDLLTHLVTHLLDQLLDEQLDVGVHVFDLLPAVVKNWLQHKWVVGMWNLIPIVRGEVELTRDQRKGKQEKKI
jgi:cadmium resistance protein CadD (predicted permease)